MVFLSNKEKEMEKEVLLNEIKNELFLNLQSIFDKIDVLENRVKKLEDNKYSELMKELPASITEGIVKAKVEEILIKNSDKILQELREKIQETMVDYEKSIITLKAHLQNLITEYQEIPKKLKETSEKLEQLVNDLDQYWKTSDNRMKAIRDSINKITESISNLQTSENEEILGSLNVLNDKIEEYKNEINKLSERINNIEKVLADIMYKIDTLEVKNYEEKTVEEEEEITENKGKKSRRNKGKEEIVEVDPNKLDDLDDVEEL